MPDEIKLYYLQDSRGSGTVGNALLWWVKDGAGYTTDLTRAMVLTEAEAQGYHNTRETDIPWPKDYIDERSRATVDCQLCKRDEALAGTPITIIKPKRPPKQIYNCGECGAFMNSTQWYNTGCTKCGWTYSG